MATSADRLGRLNSILEMEEQAQPPRSTTTPKRRDRLQELESLLEESPAPPRPAAPARPRPPVRPEPKEEDDGEHGFLEGQVRAWGRGGGRMIESVGGAVRAMREGVTESTMNPFRGVRTPRFQYLGRGKPAESYTEQAIERITGTEQRTLSEVNDASGRRLAELGRGIAEKESLAPSRSVREGAPIQADNWRWWSENIGEQVPQLASSLLLARVGGLAGFAAPTAVQEGGSAYNSTYDRLRKQGRTDEEAHETASGAALATGAGAAALERIPYAVTVMKRVPGAGRVFSEAVTRRLSSLPGRFALGATAEGLTEAAQEAWADVVEYVGTKDPEVLQGMGTRATAAGLIGAATGGLVDAATGRRPMRTPDTPASRLDELQAAISAPDAPDAPAGPAAPGAPAAPQGEQPGLRRRMADLLDPSRAQQIEQLQEERRSAQRAAHTDPLTGLANRAALDAALPSAEADPGTTVITWDGNNFGQVNKVIGQEAGDQELQRMSRAVRAAAEEVGLGERTFRRGGDEFVALVPGELADQVRSRAEELYGVQRIPGTEIDVSLSGFAGATFQEADGGLQAAKAARKAQLAGASQTPAPAAVEPPPAEIAPPAPTAEPAGPWAALSEDELLAAWPGAARAAQQGMSGDLDQLRGEIKRRGIPRERIAAAAQQKAAAVAPGAPAPAAPAPASAAEAPALPQEADVLARSATAARSRFQPGSKKTTAFQAGFVEGFYGRPSTAAGNTKAAHTEGYTAGQRELAGFAARAESPPAAAAAVPAAVETQATPAEETPPAEIAPPASAAEPADGTLVRAPNGATGTTYRSAAGKVFVQIGLNGAAGTVDWTPDWKPADQPAAPLATPQVPNEAGQAYVLPSFVTAGLGGTPAAPAEPNVQPSAATSQAPAEIAPAPAEITPDPELASAESVRPDDSGEPAGAPPAAAPAAPAERGADAVVPPAAGGDGGGVGQPDSSPEAGDGAATDGLPRAGVVGAEHPGPGDGTGAGGARPASGRGDAGGADAGVRGVNYRITERDQVGVGGTMGKARANLDAIRLLKQIEAEGRPATKAEQAVLVKYVGWGGMPQAFDEYHRELGTVARELKGLLTEEEYKAARASTLNAHYTSPEIITGIWSALARLGFTGGHILEPSAGAGHFLGLSPKGLAATSRFTAVELDNITGGIARLLYPRADVRVQGFEKTILADGSIDVAIGNVPFGDYRLHDPRYNAQKLFIHDYFFAKALDKVRPGGLVAFITSRGTMDKGNPAVRRALADKANLVASIRLPNTAFKGNAGTEVTTDLIILQRRARGETATGESWIETKEIAPGIHVNEYYARNPQMMLGQMQLAGTMYGPAQPALIAPAGQDIASALAFAVRQLPKGVYTPATSPAIEAAADPQEAIEAPDQVREGAFFVDEKGGLSVREAGKLVPVKLAKADEEKVRALVGIRDAARAVLRIDGSGGTDAQVAAAQAELGQLYDAFVKKHGPINREVRSVSTRTNKAGEAIESVTYPNIRKFRNDPDYPIVAALENYDADEDRATKADVFSKRVVSRPEVITRADTPKDALPIVLSEIGRVDVARIAELAGVSQMEAIGQLGGLIYRDPQTGAWETEDAYLSGNVRVKLAIARAAADVDPEFRANVVALEGVQPVDLLPSQIKPGVGSPWVPADVYAQFITELLGGGRVKITHLEKEALWKVNDLTGLQYRAQATQEFGLPDANAVWLFELALNQQVPTLYDRIDGKSVKNPERSLAAQEKQTQLKERFAKWAWADAGRAQALVRLYNDTMNNTVLRRFNGEHLRLPGVAAAIGGRQFRFRPHQLNAIWRQIQSGNTLLAHVVGAGKTYTMVAIIMENRRIGLAKKPMMIVPNHMLEQATREFMQLYPSAKVLVATKDDFAAERRKVFTSKVATGDWDAVIMTHRSFEAVGMSPQFEEDYIARELDDLEDMIRTAKEDQNRNLVKQIEKAKKKREARLEELRAREKKDDVLAFEELGVDLLVVDEAHLFKNLNFPTKFEGITPGTAQRATDLYMKSLYLEQINPGRGMVFATGTPISNSLAEMFVMERYLAPGGLQEAHMPHFDGWAAVHVEPATAVELDPTGAGYRLKTRLQFRNIPELVTRFRRFADIQTREMLGLPTPKVLGGGPQPIVAPTNPGIKAFVRSLMKRAEWVKQHPRERHVDNFLKITGDGAHGALDMRLVDADAFDDPQSKVNLLVDQVLQRWEKHRDLRGAQLIFSDLSTPGPKRGASSRDGLPGFNVYEDVRAKLIAAGVPAAEIAFIQDTSGDDAKKAKLFKKVRSGEVRVLLGSTEMMGVGTNVQARLVALHNLDAPWRPSDLEQRIGRIERQGNELYDAGLIEGIEILNYGQEGSFDSYKWQTLERKARFINQVMQGDATIREMDDIDGSELTYAEMKAIVSGNPAVLEKAGVDAEIAKLGRLQAAHVDQQYGIKRRMAELPERIAAAEKRVENLVADAARRVDVAGDRFRIKLGKKSYTKRPEAAEDLKRAITELQLSATQEKNDNEVPLGEFAGFALVFRPRGRFAELTLRGAAAHSTQMGMEAPAAGVLQSLEHVPRSIDKQLEAAQNHLQDLQRDQENLARIAGTPFEHQAKLDEMVARSGELTAQLNLDAQRQQQEADDAEAEYTVERIDPAPVELSAESRTRLDQVRAALEEEGGALPAGEITTAVRAQLVEKVGWKTHTRKGELNGLSDRELIERAVSAGVLDDLTVANMAEVLGARVADEGGFLWLPGMADPAENDDADPDDENGPRVLVDARPRQIGPVEGYLMPMSRLVQRLLRSTRVQVREIGARLKRINAAGQHAHMRMARVLDEKAKLVADAVAPLNKVERGRVVELLDSVATVDELPADVSPKVRKSFDLLRSAFRDDWRQLGANDRVMLSQAKRAVLDLALRTWPEGGAAPDFDHVPVNRANILAAAKRDGGKHAEPTTADGWRDLARTLRDNGRRVQKPVFMTSPDLRRIYGMIRGDGGIMAYFPHVFTGDWVVRAGAETRRFVDRMEAVQYARGLIKSGAFKEDLLVELEGFTPDGSLYTSRAHYQALTSALGKAIGAESAVVQAAVHQAGAVKVRPRKRFFSHGQQRAVNLQTFDRNLEDALKVYHYRLAKKLAFDPFRQVALPEMEQLPHRGGWRDYAESYIQDVQGVPGEFIQSVNHFFESVTHWMPGPLRTGPFSVQKAAARWQHTMSWWHLGYSPITAAVNLTQIPINVVPRFEERGHHWTWEGLLAVCRGDADVREITDYVGIDLAHPKYMAGEYAPTGGSDISWYHPLFMFNGAEKLNRSVAAVARYRFLRARGEAHAAALEGAREFAVDTNFEYNISDAPRVMRNPIGKAFLQFKNFSINQIFFSADLLRHGTHQQRATFAAYLVAFGGLHVLARATPLVLVNWLLGMTGAWEDERGDSITPWEALWDSVGPGVSASLFLRTAKYGLLAAFGVDMSERVGFGGPREFDTLPGGKVEQVARALTADSPTERDKAIRALLPSMMRRLMDAHGAATKGELRDSRGRKIDGEVSPFEVAGKAIGFRTVEETERYGRMERERRMQNNYKRDRATFMDRAGTAWAQRDTAGVKSILEEAKAEGVNITFGQVKAYRTNLDQDDTKRRVGNTSRDLREYLFTEEERDAARGRRRRRAQSRSRER